MPFGPWQQSGTGVPGWTDGDISTRVLSKSRSRGWGKRSHLESGMLEVWRGLTDRASFLSQGTWNTCTNTGFLPHNISKVPSNTWGILFPVESPHLSARMKFSLQVIQMCHWLTTRLRTPRLYPLGSVNLGWNPPYYREQCWRTRQYSALAHYPPGLFPGPCRNTEIHDAQVSCVIRGTICISPVFLHLPVNSL